MLKTIIKDPLFHFLLLGCLLFPAYGWMQQEGLAAGNKIVITQGDVNQLTAMFEKQWRRPPTEKELQGLIDARIEEEVLYREALSMGLDEDDVIIRRRLKQKLEFILDDNLPIPEPTEQQVADYFQANQAQYQTEALLSFKQWYFSVENYKQGNIEANLTALVAKLNNKQATETQLEQQSHSIMLPQQYHLAAIGKVNRDFGLAFVKELKKASIGRWVGPLLSPFGYHVVFIDRVQPEQIPPLKQVQAQVISDWKHEQKTQQKQNSLDALKASYNIVIEQGAGNAR